MAQKCENVQVTENNGDVGRDGRKSESTSLFIKSI